FSWIDDSAQFYLGSWDEKGRFEYGLFLPLSNSPSNIARRKPSRCPSACEDVGPLANHWLLGPLAWFALHLPLASLDTIPRTEYSVSSHLISLKDKTLPIS